MTLVFTGYVGVPEFDDPETWLKRIKGHTGVLEELAKTHKVIEIEKISWEGRLEKNGVQYYFFRMKGAVARFPFRLHRLIKKLQPDVVFFNGANFPLQLILLRLKLGRRPKFIILHQGEKPFRGWRRWAQKLADRFIHAYLFTSAEFGKSWNANISVQKMHEVIQASSVFQPGNRQEAKERLELTGDPLYLWVGRLVAGKDPLTVVGAFLKFARLHRGVRLYMIYQSNELLNEVQQLLNHEEDRAAVILVGKIAHEELENWFNAADFIITGSHYEGSGVAIAEAMSCGCIPITTDFISFRKMTGPGRCGFMFDTGNGSSLLHTLEQTIQADREMEREKVLRQFREELSFEAIARKINTILSS